MLRKYLKSLAISMIILILAFFSMLFLNYVLKNPFKETFQVFTTVNIALMVIVPVLGIAIFIGKVKKYETSIIKDNFDMLKLNFTQGIKYNESGKMDSSILNDPTLNAKNSTGFRTKHICSGTFEEISFIATNIATTDYIGDRHTSSTIFDGYYILLNTNLWLKEPLYICSSGFWEDKNVTLKSNNKSILKVTSTINYNLYAVDKISGHKFESIPIRESLDEVFNATDYKISIFFFEDGKVGMAIKNFKAFNFYNMNKSAPADNPIEIIKDFYNSLDIDKEIIRESINKDTLKIKRFLEDLINVIKLI